MLQLHIWLGCPSVMKGAGMVAAQGDPCDAFFQTLRAVPHVSLTRVAGPIESIWTGEPTAACQVDFETSDSALAGAVVPDFAAEPGFEMYGDGWRMRPDIVADGAGSGIYGISRGPVRCVIRWEQPTYMEDDGTFVQSDTLTVTIQCRSEARA